MLLHSQPQRGFTLIEMIVSLGVFSVVVTITTGALLMLIAGNQRYQNEQNVMTNLTFAIDSMTREIRTGTFYNCQTVNGNVPNATFNFFRDQENLGDAAQDCDSGISNATYARHGISFVEGGDSITGTTFDRIAYFYSRSEQKLFRRVGNGPAESIVSDNIVVANANFTVSGTNNLFDAGDVRQPTVTIYIEAYPEGEAADLTKRYYMQTTVTQRTLDL